MHVVIRYDPTDEIDPVAAHLLGDEIRLSDQFNDLVGDTLVIEAL